ncbi:hypothetical protein J3Q64DRAFT_1845265 [Phycomyces blakesleeanus]|uniref:PH domain-containing protein n=2 Tax=Phycomyces blakesleeanus TaxID=4837 RepID=A0A162V4M8_PHYB8|nr:hypothetical protein PHYBLDRAFT_58954 [Phycomyces blakesleeanus NRRL 1555(-)]OAD79913.1 hypothetical protein PHYBLDRAFT_58954 [Phycomyces blakesleeanus NRRL 1555(-)]|eukprot:XP_018297953.1 hypothetical protein PHYBLDRAFT_58954 [Phycomyces blakesleeanus NRRL 1555(-)]
MKKTTLDSADAPRAGRLSKLTVCPFGRPRWQSRFFVLLNSELRYYKNEHAETPSSILNLNDVDQLVLAPTPSHPFCFRLEPILNTVSPVGSDSKKDKSTKQQRPWSLECQSEIEMDLWVSAIHCRLAKLSSKTPPLLHYEQQPSPSACFFSSLLRKITPPSNSTYSDYPSSDPSRPSSFWPAMKNKPVVATQTSFSQRRGITLAPIYVPVPVHSLQVYESSDLTFESSPSDSGIQSPESTLGASSDIDYEEFKSKRSLSLPALTDFETAETESSPTFLLYKERFRL